MQLFYQPEIENGIDYLSEEESRHCIKALRNVIGDSIHIVDGKGCLFLAKIVEANPRKCTFDIVSHKTEPPLPYYIHIAVAPTKSADKMEWFVEKAVEIGVQKISFFTGHHSERSLVKPERIKKKAISAMKQSLKWRMPIIDMHKNLNSLLTTVQENTEKYVAFVDHNNPIHLKDIVISDKNYCVLIGPEGDFSNQELELCFNKNFTKVSLGKSRLRTETAALAAVHILNLTNS